MIKCAIFECLFKLITYTINLMKNIFCLTGLLFVLFSCTKENTASFKNPHGGGTTTSFTKYTIRAGQNYCDENKFTLTSYSELNFIAKFDSTAIYSTVNPDNQLPEGMRNIFRHQSLSLLLHKCVSEF